MATLFSANVAKRERVKPIPIICELRGRSRTKTGIAVVVISGRYDAAEAWITPTRIWREIVLSNVTG